MDRKEMKAAIESQDKVVAELRRDHEKVKSLLAEFMAGARIEIVVQRLLEYIEASQANRARLMEENALRVREAFRL